MIDEMTNSQKEVAAINAVSNECIKFGKLQPFTLTGDKYPCFDGDIIVRSKATERKDDIIGYIPVQVKGTRVESFSKSGIYYKVKVSDLKNYALKDGVIFFVVEINQEFKTKIYFNSLLPYDIQSVLNKKSKGDIKLAFEPLNEKKFTTIFDVCMKFLVDCKNQKGIIVKEADIKEFKVIQFDIPYYYIDKNIETYLLNNELYLKGQPINSELFSYFAKVKTIAVESPIPCNIRVVGKTFYTQMLSHQENNMKLLKIGKSVIMGKDKFDFSLKGNVYERIHDCKFIISLFENNEIEMDDNKLSIFKIDDIGAKEETSKAIKKYNEILKHLYDLKSVFDFFNIEVTQDINDFSSDTNNKLEALIKSIVYKESLMNIDNDFQYLNIEIFDRNLLAVLLNKEGKQELINYYSDIYKKIRISVFEEGIHIPLPFFYYITTENVVNDLNFNIDYIEHSICNCDKSVQAFSVSNDILLTLVKGYDITKDPQILNSCERIAKYLIDNSPMEIIYWINYYQVTKRLRFFTLEDKNKIRELRNNSLENNHLLAGIGILLENKSDFENSFNCLSEDEKNIFVKYPIYTLMQWEDLKYVQ